MTGTLILEDGTKLEGESFGAPISTAGEVVFSTGMVGYPESMTDPSYAGQILIFTYPLIGNYGVPEKRFLESDHIQPKAIIVSDYIDTPSHFQSKMTLSEWLKKEHIPGLQIKDTRGLTKKIREKGVMLGKIVIDKDLAFYDPNKDNLVAQVSPKTFKEYGRITPLRQSFAGQAKPITVLMLDCGAKENIVRSFLKRGVHLYRTPWDFDPFIEPKNELEKKAQNFDAMFISNGPGDPKMANETIRIIKKALDRKITTLGICLGNQLLALAAGGDTYKLKYGHRGQNQSCILVGSQRCYITTQNHGFAVDSDHLPKGFKPWFINANDNSNEGIIHETLPFMTVQFHPEATPGPVDADWIFDYFLERIKNSPYARHPGK